MNDSVKILLVFLTAVLALSAIAWLCWLAWEFQHPSTVPMEFTYTCIPPFPDYSKFHRDRLLKGIRHAMNNRVAEWRLAQYEVIAIDPAASEEQLAIASEAVWQLFAQPYRFRCKRKRGVKA